MKESKMAHKNMRVINAVFVTVMACCISILSACSWQLPHTIVEGFEGRKIRLIAVMPVEKDEQYTKEAKKIREMFLEKLYFHGYPKIPLSLVDEKILELTGNSSKANSSAIAKIPSATVSCGRISQLLGVNAVVYIKINALNRTVNTLAASYEIDVDFTMCDSRTMETIWSVNYNTSEWLMDAGKQRVDIKSVMEYEAQIDAMLKNVIETLPKGSGI